MQPVELQVGSIKGHKTTSTTLHTHTRDINMFSEKDKHLQFESKVAGDDPLDPS